MTTRCENLDLAFRFRRRPVHFRVAAAVKAGETVPALPARIRQGDKGDGGVVKGTGWLVVEEMHLGHHRD